MMKIRIIKNITLTLLLTSLCLQMQGKPKKLKLRGYYLNAVFSYSFINSENRRAVSRIYLTENKSFEYRERAGRGTTIFIGTYKITENKITLTNNNGITRMFNYKLSKNSLKLISRNVNNNKAILFHIQPINKQSAIKYKRVDYKKLNPLNKKAIAETFIYSKSNNLYAVVFNPDLTYTYKSVINGKNYTILKGKYLFKNNRIYLEDKYGIKFLFTFLMNKKQLKLKLLSSKLLVPFNKNSYCVFKRVKLN